MDRIQLFLSYAKEFERTYKDDDWGRLDPFFAEDAVYEVTGVPFGCRIAGRAAIFRAIRKSVEGFDRRMDSRRIEVLSPPQAEGDEFRVAWAATYKLGELPPLRIAARTVARYRGDRIEYLGDHYDEASGPASLDWVARAEAATGEKYDFAYT